MMTEQTPSMPVADAQTPPPSPPVPKGPSWKRITLWIFIAAIGVGIGVWFGQPIKAALRLAGEVVGIGHEHAEYAEENVSNTYYTCGMHPWVVLPEPGDCPICHMKLTPIDPDKFTGEIAIDPVVVQNMGVRVQSVVTGPLVKTIRTVGTIDYDETSVRDVNTKIGGWIEKLYVDYIGAQVEQGDPLFDIYSPDLYAAQEEYLLAWRNRDQIGADFVPDAAKGALDLLDAARTRLEYYDITEQQIEALREANQPAKTMTIQSPHTGVVIDKHANEGMKVDTGMRVFRIADLTRVWVMVTLYEYQLPYVSVGQKATMTLPYIPGETFEGRVIYVYPYLDKQTRQVNVRLEFENPNQLLKPGMYVNVHLRSELAAERTLAPRSAVIDTGERQVAFVSLGEGRFEPRQVHMGVETSGGMVEILDGLKPGEMVVTSGQFLIDSEANIREALAKMIRGDLASDQQVSATMAGKAELDALPDAAATALEQLLEQYFIIGDKLASDTVDGVEAPARRIAELVDALLAVQIPDRPHFWHQHEEAASIRGGALEMIQVTDMAEARLKFADISVALNKLVRATGVPPTVDTQVLQLHCPMYREGQGGSIWLQPAGAVRNPFYGSSMLGCFDERYTLPVTGGVEGN
jgi:RND family efflux transporter MFP subunit